jgi:hypothetical protein
LVGDPNGIGANNSKVSFVTTENVVQGVTIEPSVTGAHLHSVHAKGCGIGVVALDGSRDAILESITVEGFTIRGATVRGSGHSVNGLTVKSGPRGLDIGPSDSASISNVFCYDCTTTDVRVLPTATDTTIFGGRAAIGNEGVGTQVTGVNGTKNRANYQSSPLSVDSVGSKVFTITHGLGRTPAIEDIHLTLQRVTTVEDYVVRFLRVEAVSSTQITGRLYLHQASATVGATVIVNVLYSAVA